MTVPTFIAILDLATSASDRTQAIEHLERQRPEVKSMAGCVDFRVFASGESDHAITVLHEWADAESFDAYVASDLFAESGAILRPLMTEPPSSRRFRAELIETVG